jgi:RHS repeat-associated protein
VSNDGTTDYTYDNNDQLLGADHHSAANPAESYTYDTDGNRASSGTQANTYTTGADNRLSTDGTFNYTYDNEGNLIQRTEIATNQVRTFQWDERNRLTAVIDKDAAGKVIQQVLFTYDTLNNRMIMEVKQGGSDVATDFISDRGNPLLDFVDADGPAGPNPPVLALRYLTGPALDQVFAQETSGGVLWLLSDNLGSVRDLLDNSGAVVNHINYDSFGNVLAQTDSAVTTRFLYAGRGFDAGTGFYYDRARYYDPKLGRFLSEDPIGFLGGSNLYLYVHNSPVSRTDPLGTQDDNPDGMSVPEPEQPEPGNICTPDEPDPANSSPGDQPAPQPQPTPDSTALEPSSPSSQTALPNIPPVGTSGLGPVTPQDLGPDDDPDNPNNEEEPPIHNNPNNPNNPEEDTQKIDLWDEDTEKIDEKDIPTDKIERPKVDDNPYKERPPIDDRDYHGNPDRTPRWDDNTATDWNKAATNPAVPAAFGLGAMIAIFLEYGGVLIFL